ncbi:hypothetical protein SASPL_125666 [Salvia splendens]|uniref:Wall-associated receptor kinase galacturonan-binding domain-containing protein n=1 Tax=Salvia splendens TaxID=180675 RepID=A0A8X8XFM6_SALSN|nr:hypothetical protein SASPL_125666 [Salvia splendens]
MRLRCSQSQWPTMAGAAEAINDGSGELVPVAAFVDEEHRTRTGGSQVYDREKKPIRIGIVSLTPLMFPSILVFISFLCLTTTKSQEISWTINKDCQTKCGNVTIPYPFGVGPGCSFNASFTITCNTTTTTTPERPFLSSINLEVLNISVHGVVIVNQPVSPVNCSADRRLESMPMSLQGSPFTISPRYNTLAVLGCTNAVWITTSSGTATVGGCMSICEANSNSNSSSSSSCDGLNCCKATIPAGLKSFQFSYRSIQSNNEFCGYAFPVYQKWFRQDYTRYRGLQINQSYPYDQNFVSAPLVLEWELDIPAIDDSLVVCKLAANYRYPTSSDEYTDPSTSFYLSNYYNEYAYGYISSTKYCSCQDGYQGNPYVFQGCIDIDECALNETRTYGNVTRNYYCSTGTCINKIGSYTCRYADNDASTKPKIALITIGAQNEDCGKESEAIEVDEMYEDFSSITGSMRFDSSSITVDDDRRLLGQTRVACGYAFPVDKKRVEQDYNGLHTDQYDQELVSAPLVLKWELDHPNINMLAICNRATNYRSFSSSNAYTDPSTLLYIV